MKDSYQIALERIQKNKKSTTPVLDLSELKLHKLPEELYTLTHLEELKLSNSFAITVCFSFIFFHYTSAKKS